MSNLEELTDKQLAKQSKVALIKIYSVLFTVLLPLTLLTFLAIGLEKAVDLAGVCAGWFSKQVNKIGPIVFHERGPFRFMNRLRREAEAIHAEEARRARRERDKTLFHFQSETEGE